MTTQEVREDPPKRFMRTQQEGHECPLRGSAERIVLFLSDLNDYHFFRHSVGTSNPFERNERFPVDINY